MGVDGHDDGTLQAWVSAGSTCSLTRAQIKTVEVIRDFWRKEGRNIREKFVFPEKLSSHRSQKNATRFLVRFVLRELEMRRNTVRDFPFRKIVKEDKQMYFLIYFMLFESLQDDKSIARLIGASFALPPERGHEFVGRDDGILYAGRVCDPKGTIKILNLQEKRKKILDFVTLRKRFFHPGNQKVGRLKRQPNLLKDEPPQKIRFNYLTIVKVFLYLALAQVIWNIFTVYKSVEIPIDTLQKLLECGLVERLQIRHGCVDIFLSPEAFTFKEEMDAEINMRNEQPGKIIHINGDNAFEDNDNQIIEEETSSLNNLHHLGFDHSSKIKELPPIGSSIPQYFMKIKSIETFEQSLPLDAFRNLKIVYL